MIMVRGALRGAAAAFHVHLHHRCPPQNRREHLTDPCGFPAPSARIVCCGCSARIVCCGCSTTIVCRCAVRECFESLDQRHGLRLQSGGATATCGESEGLRRRNTSRVASETPER